MIGCGISGAVYKKDSFAIKRFSRDNDEISYSCNFIIEVKVMKMCYHKNVMKSEYVQVDSNTFTSNIRMKLGIGHLNEYIAKTFDIREIMKQVAKGLCYLESNDILHLDIKPQNIIMFKEGDGVYPVISDFNLVAICPGRIDMKGIIGTSIWLAPEILLELDPPTYKSVVWSFGLIWQQMTNPIKISDCRSRKIIRSLCKRIEIDSSRVSKHIKCEYVYSGTKIENPLLMETLRWSPEDRLSMKEVCQRLGCSIYETDISFEQFTISKQFIEKMKQLVKTNKQFLSDDISHAALIHHYSGYPATDIYVSASLALSIIYAGEMFVCNSINCSCSKEELHSAICDILIIFDYNPPTNSELSCYMRNRKYSEEEIIEFNKQYLGISY